MTHLLAENSIAQHRKSNKRLHKTSGWILVETADFKNRGEYKALQKCFRI